MKKTIVICTMFFILVMSCTYYPALIRISIKVVDEGEEPIMGISCIMARNGEQLHCATTDNMGVCILETRKEYNDRYVDDEVFISQLVITFIDNDGAANGGEFENFVYYCKQSDVLNEVKVSLRKK